MIYPLTGLVLGAILGIVQAWRRGGKLFDLLQWGIVFALIFGLAGLIVLIFIERQYV